MSITSRISSMEEHVTNAYNGLQGLGADLTNVNKNIENISVVLDDIYDSLPSVSGEGTSLTLDDTRVGKIKSTLKGNTSQDGTPTPDSPIPVNVVSGDNEINVCGKNLLGFENGTYTNNQGIVATVENGKITLNGTGTANPSGVTIPLTNIITIPSNVGYNLSAFNGSTNSNVSLRLQAIESSNPYTNVTLSNINANETIQANEQYKVDRLYIRCNQGTALSNFIIQPQIEKGSTATTYEPYIGKSYPIHLGDIELCKIGNYQDYFGKSDGRNLFDKSTITTSAYLKEDGTLQTGTGAEYITSDFIPVKPNTTYYKTQTLSPRTKFYDKNKQVLDSSTYQDISIGGNAGSFTTPNNAYYFRFTGNVNTSTGININTTMVNEGSSALPYQPYGVGKWYLHKEIGKVTYNGTEPFGYSDSGVSGIKMISKILNDMATGNYLNGFSNYFKNNMSGKNANTIRLGANDKSFYIYINESDFASVDAWKTWLTTHNTNIYYILATPTNTEITYQPLIDQLNLLEKAMSKDGQTNISQVNNDLPFIISASALKEWQESSSLNSTLSMVNPLSLGNTLNTQEIENNTQPIEVDNIEPLEEEENEES